MSAIDEINAVKCWDYRVASFDGWRLRIIGGADLSYPDSHVLEVEFRGVSYLSCPMEFSHAEFRDSTDDERKAVGQIVDLSDNQEVVVIEAEASGSITPKVFFIVSAEFEVKKKPNEV